MCGRYSLTSRAYEEFIERLGAHFDTPGGAQAPDRYNIAPLQPVPVIRLKGSDRDQPIIAGAALPDKEIALMRWGLVPHWAKEMSKSRPLINGRSETIAEKPSFRGPFRRRKCLVPASGFYEWKRARAKQSTAPVPHYFSLENHTPFAFAGIWEIWMGPHGEDWLETVSLITKAASPLMKPIHHRSPVIVDPTDYNLWLRPHDPPDPEIFSELSTTIEGSIRMTEVSGYVNNARHEGPQCIAPFVTESPLLF